MSATQEKLKEIEMDADCHQLYSVQLKGQRFEWVIHRIVKLQNTVGSIQILQIMKRINLTGIITQIHKNYFLEWKVTTYSSWPIFVRHVN